MTLLEKIKQIKEIENIDKETVEELKPYGFFTGSRRFKVHSDDSDLDFVISPECPLGLDDIIQRGGVDFHADSELGLYREEELGPYREEEFSSCYIMHEGRIINLLFMHSDEYYCAWSYATSEFEKFLALYEDFRERIKNKKFRVETFEEFKRQYIDLKL